MHGFGSSDPCEPCCVFITHFGNIEGDQQQQEHPSGFEIWSFTLQTGFVWGLSDGVGACHVG